VPVSKHRRRGKLRPRKPGLPPTTDSGAIGTIDALRPAIADPGLDFRAKVALAAAWWFDALLRQLGGAKNDTATSTEDVPMSGSLLCMAMDGERGKNDALSPLIADMLRPYCPTATFAEAWEQANGMPPGTIAALAVKAEPAPAAPGPAR